MRLGYFIESAAARVAVTVIVVIVASIVAIVQIQTAKKEEYNGTIIKAHKKMKFRSSRRRAFSSATGNSAANYNYYWDIKTDDGRTLERKVPFWEWEGSKEGDKVVKEKGTQYPSLIPDPEDIMVVDDEGNEIGSLKDVMEQAKANAPPPGQATPVSTEGMSVEQKLALTNSNLDAQAALMQGQGAPPQVANVPPPQAFPQSAIPSAQAYAAQPAPVAPTPEPTPVDPNVTPTPAPTPVFYSNVPVSTLWPRYTKAVQLIESANPQGVAEFERVISSDDLAWLNRNMLLMAELVSPGRRFASAADAKLMVYKAIVRNMPRTLDTREPAVKMKDALAMADVYEKGAAGPVKYSTALVQEGGRWVIAHLFGARDFVWVPQLALYKQARNIPLAIEEQSFLTQGFAPFQQRVRQVYAMTGYQ